MRLPYVLLAGLFACATACEKATPPTGFGVDLTIDARTLAERASVQKLTITSMGAQTFPETIDVASQMKGEGVVRVRWVPSVTTGSLTFAVVALDSHALVVSSKTSDPVTLVANGAAHVTITLADSMMQPGDMSGPGDMVSTTCNDGKQQTGEVDIDCGGPCPPCEPDKKCFSHGDCATDTCVLNKCELATGPPSWVPLASLPVGRNVAAAGGAENGYVYVAGGYTTAIDATTLRFSLDTNDWVAVGALAQARESMAYTVAGGRLFVLGGEYAIAMMPDDYLVSIEAFDPTAELWTVQQRTLSAKRSAFAAVLGGDGQIYAVGGDSAPSVPTPVFESFDPAADAPAPLTGQAVLPAARAGAGAADDALGRVLAIGGRGTDAHVTTRVDVYDTAGKAWNTAPALEVARSFLGAALGADGRVYAVGGLDDIGGALASVEALGPTSDHWTAVPTISPARAGAAVTRGWDGRIYAIGGSTTTGPDATVQAYGPRVQPGPSTGAAGTAIAISCTNFAANAKITVTFSGDAMGTVATSGVSDATGTASPSLVWKVPAVASGTYVLTAVDDHARYPVRARFVVP